MKNLSMVIVFLVFFSAPLFVQSADLPDIERIDINSAPLEDLVKIIHIGEVRAKELISLRPFSSLDDLAKIKGINKTRVEDIKKQGLAWVGPETQNKTTKEVKNDLKENGNNEEKNLVAIGEQTPEKSSSPPSLIALSIAIFSGIVVLAIKRKLKNLDLLKN